MSARYIILDTETGGLNVEDGVVEIGWVELDADANIIDQVDSLIDPGTGRISPSASGVHGITYDMVADKPTLEEFFTEQAEGCYGKPLEGAPLCFGAHKASFDRTFVDPYLKGEVLELCTLRLAKSIWPDAENHKLSTLKYALDLPTDEGAAHRVMADVRVTYHLLRRIMEVTHSSLDQLAERCKEPFLLHRMSFGKHRGEPFSSVPRSYLNWMRNNFEDLAKDIDLAYTVTYYLEN